MEAEQLYRRALENRKAALGPEHCKTACILHNLAELLRAQGRFAEAEPLHRRALAIFEEKLGPEPPYNRLLPREPRQAPVSAGPVTLHSG